VPMKRPNFLEGVAPSSSAPRRAAEVPVGLLRPVAWAAAPSEPAAPLPAQTLSAPPRGAAAHAPGWSAPPGAGFEPLGSAGLADPPTVTDRPLPPPPPPPPPAATLGTERLERLDQAVATLRLQGERLAEQARSDSIELRLLVARRILEREVTTNLESLFALVKTALRRIGESRITTVRLSPSDFQRVKTAPDDALSLGPVALKADEALEPGDVMVDTEHGTVDGRLGTRLVEIARALEAQEG
jgi:flagellar assembly protein FliH